MPRPMDGNAYTTGGVFVSNEIVRQEDGYTVSTPCKAIPIGRLQVEDGEEVSSNARNLVEIVCDVDEDSLIAFEASSESKLEETIEGKIDKTDPDELVVCYWRYTGTSPISKRNMQRMVSLSEEYSDIIMPPLQHSLLQSFSYDDIRVDVNQEDERVSKTRDYNLLRLYQIGVERYLEATEDIDQLTAAPIPFLKEETDWLETLIADYDELGIELLSFNMLRKKPTSPPNRRAIQGLIGFMRRIDYFDATLKYTVNVCHSYDAGENTRSAEDLALAGIGFDIIGENHWFAPQDYGTDYERGCRIFDSSELLYQNVSQSSSGLDEVWPGETTKMNLSAIKSAHQNQEMIRQEKLLNAEQLELALKGIRSHVDDESIYEFLQEYNGYELLEDSLCKVATEYQNPTRPQSALEDFS